MDAVTLKKHQDDWFWIDSMCDLQLKDIAKELGIGEMRKSEITNKIKLQ
jgi:hypothetical protein